MLLQIAPAVDTAAVMDMAAAVVQTKEKIPIMDLAIKGGWIMIPIVLLLLVSIYVFVERWIVISKASKNEAGLMYSIRDYILDGRLDSAKTLCCNTDTPTARIIEKGIDRVGKPIENIKSAMEDAGNLEVAKLERRISWLSTTAGAAPMLGFLGTVTGMVRVFFDMASKGNNIEVGTLATPSRIVAETLAGTPFRFDALSGPSFAAEVMRGLPTAVVLAGREADLVRRLRDLLSGPRFRCYSSADVMGVEMGGALKNISIGCASAAHGKKQLHNVQPDGKWPAGEGFMERMADAGKAIAEHFGPHIVYINVLRNMSIDCDCAGVAASTPTMPDLGIFASADLLAIDQASIDLVYAMPDFMKHTLVKRIKSRKGLRQLSAMKALGLGTGEYRIVRVLEKKPGQRPLEDGTDEV